MSPRLPRPERAEIGTIAWVVTRVLGLVAGTEPPQLFTHLALRPKLFRSWLRFASRLMPGGTLPRRVTELVILRVAHLCQCPYELEHHRRLAQRAGVTVDEVEAIAAGPARFTGSERLVLEAVDQLHGERRIDDDLWRALAAHFTPGELIELLVLVGHYEMLALVIGGLELTPDEPRRRH